MNESLIWKIHANWEKGFHLFWLTSLFPLFCWGFIICWNVFFSFSVCLFLFLSVKLLFDSLTNTLFFSFHLFLFPFSVHFFLWITYFHFHLNLYLSILFLSTLIHSINQSSYWIFFFFFNTQQRFLRTLNSPMFPKEPKEFVCTYYLTKKVQNTSPIS